MTIKQIIGENGNMPKLCNGGSCPSAIIVEGGDVFIQGYIPTESECGHLTGPQGEGFVRMPLAVFEKIARQVLNS